MGFMNPSSLPAVPRPSAPVVPASGPQVAPASGVSVVLPGDPRVPRAVAGEPSEPVESSGPAKRQRVAPAGLDQKGLDAGMVQQHDDLRDRLLADILDAECTPAERVQRIFKLATSLGGTAMRDEDRVAIFLGLVDRDP